MELKDVINFQLKRANPFPGLMIDVDTWQDAHNYHRDQQRLHIMAFHQTGILGGLEVNANNPPDLSVTIRPGMAIDPDGTYCHNQIKEAKDHEVKVAVLYTGKKETVFVDLGEGRFEPREITVGLQDESGYVEIQSGIAEGERVVTSAQFMLDSESKLREVIQKMMEPSPAEQDDLEDLF